MDTVINCLCNIQNIHASSNSMKVLGDEQGAGVHSMIRYFE